MKTLLTLAITVLPWLGIAQQQYQESEHPNNMVSGVYHQSGPGSNNALNWAYPYGTKLTVMGSTHRNFELATTHYLPYGELMLRQWNPGTQLWGPWRQVLVENLDGKYRVLGEFGIGDLDNPRGSALLKISRGVGGKDKALISFGDSEAYKWHTGMLYGGGWSTPEFYISQKDHFRDGNGNYIHEPEFTITPGGDVGIGTRTPDARLAVNGNIHAKEVKVDMTGWPDHVFTGDHNLPTLEEVEKHIKEKGHLINIPSAKEVEEHGIELGEMNRLLLEKIEELTLYTIELGKQLKHIKGLKPELQYQSKEIDQPNPKIDNPKR